MSATTVIPKFKKNTQPATTLLRHDGESNCIVAKGTKIKGKIEAQESVRVNGHLDGEIDCEHRLVVGPEGRIDGTLVAAEALIMGQVFGEIKVRGVLHLKSTALIEGTIFADELIVDEGARYNGNCRIGVK